MRTSRIVSILAVALVVTAITASGALAQVSLHPSNTPVRNDGGWIFSIAWLMAAIAGVVGLLLVVSYMRFAPRFSRDEEHGRVVRADRVLPGREPPRRAVDLSQAAPVVVQPPAIPAMATAAPEAPAAAPAASAPAAAPAVAAEPAAAEPTPSRAATETAAEPAAEVPAAAPEAAAAPAAPAERAEVTMDQEVFDQKLAELLEKGTDRRVAEGQARRAGMIAARKKAAGEG